MCLKWLRYRLGADWEEVKFGRPTTSATRGLPARSYCMIFRLRVRHRTGFLLKHGRISRRALERSSSSTNLCEKKAYVSTDTVIMSRFTFMRLLFFQRFQQLSPVVTLDPNKFAEKNQQRLNIGDLQSFRPYIKLRSQSSLVLLSPKLVYDTKKESNKQIYLPYPPDTKAFLYYFTPPENPPIAGELRLRVTSSDDPTSFESGSDLLKRNGHTWSRPLFFISKCYISLYEKLREELLVPDKLDAALSTIPHKSLIYRRSHILYTLNDTFIVNFGIRDRFLTIITEQGLATLRFNGAFHETTAKYMPYRGEPSSLESPRLMILMNL